MSRSVIVCAASLLFLMSAGSFAVGVDPVAWWSFDRGGDNIALDKASETNDAIEGKFKSATGVVGSALKLDGYTTCITREASKAPKLTGNFTIEAWLAKTAYAWNWCPIITQSESGTSDGVKTGYNFTVGPRGEIRLELAVNGQWYSCQSEDFDLPLRKWIHVAGV